MTLVRVAGTQVGWLIRTARMIYRLEKSLQPISVLPGQEKSCCFMLPRNQGTETLVSSMVLVDRSHRPSKVQAEEQTLKPRPRDVT